MSIPAVFPPQFEQVSLLAASAERKATNSWQIRV
jgi:hypothetical protein